MNKKQWAFAFWQAVAAQSAKNLNTYFAPDATINWHNTNEQFSVDEFIRANCEYPGSWCGQVERVEVVSEDLVVTVTRVWSAEDDFSCHAVTFFELREDKITRVDEYWGDDGTAPQWRLDKKIGRPIV